VAPDLVEGGVDVAGNATVDAALAGREVADDQGGNEVDLGRVVEGAGKVF
jgi:hypothetical protein